MSTRDDAALNYVECDLPPGVTIAEYRRGRVARARAAKSEQRRRRRIHGRLRRVTLRCGPGPGERMP